MTRDAWPTWPDRVVARYPLWRREALLLFPLGIIAVLIPNAGKTTDWASVLQWSMVALAGATAGWTYIALFSRLFLGLYRKTTSDATKAIWVVASGSSIGVVFALGVSVTTQLLGLDDNEPLWLHISATAIIFAWFGIALTLGLDARTRLRTERDRLLQEAVALELARISTTAMIDEMREEVAQSVEQVLAGARTSIDQHIGEDQAPADLTHWEDVAATLRTTASDTVRPLSRSLWESASDPLWRPRPWSLVAYVVGHQPLRPLAVSVIYVLGEVTVSAQRLSTLAAALELVLGVVAIVAVMSVANGLMRRWPMRHVQFFIGAALLLQVPVLLNSLGPVPVAAANSTAGTIAAVLAGLIVILATSTFGAVRTMTQQQLDVIAAEVDEEFVESTARSQALAEVMREASAVMHGAVQSRLLGCAMAVEDAGRSRDAEQFSSALARARTELENPLPALSRPAATSLLEELERRRDLWEGLCEVVYQLPADMPDLPPSTVAMCGRIVEEGISNATRHGEAQRVVIRIELPDDSDLPPTALRITVTDDGDGVPEGPLSTGLGLRMIASVATSWTLTTADGHGQLVVTLPVA